MNTPIHMSNAITARFERFHNENPHVYSMFQRFSLKAIQAGMKRLSGHFILARMRWESAIETKGDPFKINDNYSAYYVRKFIADFPQYAATFETRRIRAA
ncbi:hypothetical protein [Mesorhizobium sp. M0296]|uniref:hypothetical protein n=1 Tax=Mesorhizobium sp. M0296 TaxID=2956931 RepID=UPI003338C113